MFDWQSNIRQDLRLKRISHRPVHAPPATRADRAEAARGDGPASADAKMQKFLLGRLQTYEALGETELATRKLGDVPARRQAFLDVQRDLHRNQPNGKTWPIDLKLMGVMMGNQADAANQPCISRASGRGDGPDFGPCPFQPKV